jgi:bacteriorhodopsin
MSNYESSDNKSIPKPAFSTSVPLTPSPPPNVTPNLATSTNKEKEDVRKNPIHYYVKASFMITYILLLTTATITFIEAMRTQVPNVRHILNLETCISIIAGYFYSVFLAQIENYAKDDKPVDWKDISKTRYIDWSITTPMMLLALCIVLSMHSNQKITLPVIVTIIALNYIMLLIGFLGEISIITRYIADICGFIPFVAMFYLIFVKFVQPKYVFSNYCLFFFYLLVWGMYGLAYLIPETYKNISMNILDCIAKCLIGLGLWVYYSKTIIY